MEPKSKISLKIDGSEVTADEGMTILEAAQQAGIHIPTLCHHPAVPPAGACRICVVEIKSGHRPGLVPACSYPAEDGLAIETHSERVLNSRRMTLSLMLLRAPKAELIQKMAEEYGEAGREAYIRARFTFDIAWPLVYTFFLVTTISWIYSRTFPPESWWRRANLAPILAMVFDLLENLSTSLVMYRFPERTPVVDSLATVFTSLKWFFVTGSFLLLIGGILVGLRRWYKRRRAAEGNLIS